MKEEWKDIIDYEGLYQVSNLGRIKRKYIHRKEKVLKQCLNENGYLHIALCKNGKRITKSVHKIVAIHFLPNSNNLPQINHKDENKKNNCVDNLEWCDAKYNNNYGSKNKRQSVAKKNDYRLSKSVVCIETGIVYPSTMEAERKLNIYHNHIGRCCNGKQKIAGGYHWEYKEY